MKKSFLSFILILFVSVFTLNAQSNTKKVNPVGTWKFEAPAAPEGYTSGTITIGIAEKQHTASMSFSGSEYKIPGEMVKFAGDSLQFTVYVEGSDVNVFMRLEPNNKMTGKAVYSEGEVPITATKEVPQSK
jgi:hypothetical protein